MAQGEAYRLLYNASDKPLTGDTGKVVHIVQMNEIHIKVAFSVAMCVYKKDDPVWFRTAVDSILDQTKRPDEVVLVVDGPIPEELNHVILDCEADPLFSVIRLAENQGHGKAREVSLRNCRNEWIALMDADDISCPDRFEKQIRFLQSAPECDIVGGQITEFLGEPKHIIGERMVPEADEEIKVYAQKRCPMNQVTVMFRKSAVEQAGGYIDWHCEEDYYLWLRMMEHNMVFANLPDVLVNVRAGEDMYQRRGGWKYFTSEHRLQKYMYDRRIIGIGRYLINVTERFILQVLMPNKLRSMVFQYCAREKHDERT